MKRFLVKLVCVAMATIVLAAGVIFYYLYESYSYVDDVYSIKENHTILALGSSQVGCSILESKSMIPRWHSETVPISSLMRLLELERRGELAKVDAVIVYCNGEIFRRLSGEDVYKAIYGELPLTLRYTSLFGIAKTDFLKYFFDNFRFPPNFSLLETPPSNRPDVTLKDEDGFNKFRKSVCQTAKDFLITDQNANYRVDLLLNCYRQMKNVCDRHSIRFIVVKFPMLSLYESNLTQQVRENVSRIFRELESSGVYCYYPNQYPDKFYSDAMHMNESGAKKFTDDLRRALTEKEEK